MTRFILIRHGESTANVTHQFAGYTDFDLSARGLEQAKCTAEALMQYPIDAVFASDLRRARKTGQALADVKGIPLYPDRQLREIFGGKWESLCFQDIAVRYPKEHAVWLSDIGNARPVGGESVRELQCRISTELARLAQEWDGKTLAIATHATPIRVMSTIWNGKDITAAKDYPWVFNASYSVADLDNGKWILQEYNVHAHLKALLTTLPPNV